MTIYQITDNSLVEIQTTTFASKGIKERNDLQRLLRDQIDVVSPETLIIAEEFGEWEDSRRRVDLLGIDKQANLVVIELKRTEDGGHMELQAVRYAAMVSTLTFSKAVEIFEKYLDRLGADLDAESTILEFLEWDESNDDEFAQDVKIVLASAEFSKELTTAVIWLNNNGLDIRCVRMKPYSHEGRIYLDVQQVIPLPEAEEYQVSIRHKSIKEKESRTQNRDLTKYSVTLGDTILERLPKRRAIFHIVKYLCDCGIDPELIDSLIPWRGKMFYSFVGSLDSAAMEKAISEKQISIGTKPQPKRYFIDDDELIFANGKTYAFHKMWGRRTVEALEILVNHFEDKQIGFKESD